MLGLALLVAPASEGPARALDVEVDASTSFAAYEVRSPGAGTFLARQRLVVNLGLRLEHALTEPDREGRVIRISIAGRLRLDQNFGDDCLVPSGMCLQATSRGDLAAFQPLAGDTRLDVPLLHAAVDGLPYGLGVRLGRQTIYDAIGFARFDGAQVTMAPASFVQLEADAGLLVRRTTLGGSSAFEPQGSYALDLGGLDPRVVAWADPARTTWLAGASIHGGPASYLQIGAAFRQLWDDDGSIVARRLGFTLTSDVASLLRLDGIAVLDLLDGTVIQGLASAELHEDGWSMRLSYERQVPRFDPGTIWAWFVTAPIDQLRLSGSHRFTPDLELGGAVRGRRAQLGAQWGDDLDAGLEGWMRARIERLAVSASGFGWSGSLGPVAGVSLDLSRPIIPELALEAHLSFWHFDDPNREGSYGDVVSESLVGVATLTAQSRVYVELSHAHNRVVGDRFRGIVTLLVETWR
ncbi:MAG: hypothetical protein U0234_00445 [Sandaracinus sp.]